MKATRSRFLLLSIVAVLLAGTFLYPRAAAGVPAPRAAASGNSFDRIDLTPDVWPQPEYVNYMQQRGAHVAGTPTTSDQARQSVAAWTFMVYMAADNDLEAFALADLNEMEFVGSTTDVNIVVQLDRSELYDTSNGNWTDARRIFVTRDTNLTQVASEVVDDVGETNTGAPGDSVGLRRLVDDHLSCPALRAGHLGSWWIVVRCRDRRLRRK